MPTGLGGEVMWLCPSLDDSPNDLSGNGNNGTYVNGTSTAADSDPTYGGSRAYDFDGTDDYIDAPTSVVEGLSTGAISMWFKADSSASGTRRFLMSAGAGAAGQDATYFDIGPSTGSFDNESLGVAVLNSSQGVVVAGFYRNGGSFFFDDSWHHVVYMSDSTGNSMYIDGVLVSLSYIYGSSASSQGLFRTGLTRFYIGVRDWNGLGGFFSGYQDDVRVYNRVLTQSEITLLASTRGFTAGGGTHVHRTLLGVG